MLKHILLQTVILLSLCTVSFAYSSENSSANDVGNFGMYVVDYLAKNPDVKELKLYHCIGRGLTRELRCRTLKEEPYSVTRDRVFDKSTHCNERAGHIITDNMNWHPDESPWQFGYHVTETPDVNTSGYYVIFDMNKLEFSEVTRFSEHGSAKYFWDMRVTKDLYGYSERHAGFPLNSYDEIRNARSYFKFVPIRN